MKIPTYQINRDPHSPRLDTSAPPAADGVAHGLSALGAGGMELAGALFKARETARVSERQILQNQIADRYNSLQKEMADKQGIAATSYDMNADRDKLTEKIQSEFITENTDAKTAKELMSFIQAQHGAFGNWSTSYQISQATVAEKEAAQSDVTAAYAAVNQAVVGDLSVAADQTAIIVKRMAERRGEDVSAERLAEVHDTTYNEFVLRSYDRWFKENPAEAVKIFKQQRKALERDLQPKVFNALVTANEKATDAAHEDTAYRELMREFNGDFAAMSSAIIDQKRYKKYGLDFDQAFDMHKRFLSETTQQRVAEAARIKMRDDKAITDAINKLYPDDTTTNIDVAVKFTKNLVRVGGLSGDVGYRMIQSMMSMEKEDPDTVNSILNRIYKEDITSVDALYEFFGKGLGRSFPMLAGKIDQIQQRKKEAKINYYSRGVQNFHGTVYGDGAFTWGVDANKESEFSDQVRARYEADTGKTFDPYDPKLQSVMNAVAKEGNWEDTVGKSAAMDRKARQEKQDKIAAEDRKAKAAGKAKEGMAKENYLSRMRVQVSEIASDSRNEDSPEYHHAYVIPKSREATLEVDIRQACQLATAPKSLMEDDPIFIDMTERLMVKGNVNNFDGTWSDDGASAWGTEMRLIDYIDLITAHPDQIPGASVDQKARYYLELLGVTQPNELQLKGVMKAIQK